MDDIMTVQEVANYLKIDYATVWRLCIIGTLRAFRVGHVWRIERNGLARLMGHAPLRVLGQRASRPTPTQRHRLAVHGHKL